MSLMSNTAARVDLTKLRDAIVKHFNEDELRDLCFDLGVDYDELPPGGKASKARELVAYMERQRRLPELAKAVLTRRPHLPPHTIVLDTQFDHAPFKGLLPFDEADAALFFGREALVARLLEHIADNSFLAVVGASGSGKSSVVRAGLIPALRGRSLPNGTKPLAGSAAWPIFVLKPTADPLKELASHLTRDSESVRAATVLMDDMTHEPRSLDIAVTRLLAGSNVNHALLVIDQFEELFTLCHDEMKRRAFVDNLVTAVSPETAGSTRIIITLRADFYSHCLQYGTLPALLEQHQRIVGPMEPVELRQAIELPAQRVGLAFEPGVVELLLRDVGATAGQTPEPGALPLLSHALLETWQRREGHLLTLAGYTAAGGVRGAIAQTANKVLDQQLTQTQQVIARNIILSLTEIGEIALPTRRRAELEDLLSQPGHERDAEQVLQTLVSERLLIVNREGENVTVEVSHEALLREWNTLKEWLDEYSEQLRLRRVLSRDAREWKANGRDPSYLYTGEKLNKATKAFRSLNEGDNSLARKFDFTRRTLSKDELSLSDNGKPKLESHAVQLNELENSFLNASIHALNKKEADTRRQRLRWTGLIIVFLLILGLSQVDWYGGKWEKLVGIDGGNITTIAINPGTTSNVYAAVEGINESVLFVSYDEGNSWIRSDQGLHKTPINDILIDPRATEIVYLATEGGGVFKSIDGGETWSPVNTGLRNFTVKKVIIHPENGWLYLATYGRDGGIYKSESAGLSWHLVNSGLPIRNINDLSINSEGELFAATEDDGVYKSNDGSNWQPTALTAVNVKHIVVNPFDPQIIYAGTQSRGVFRTSDGGDTWQPINNGLPDEKQITAFIVSPTLPENLYLALNTKGGNHLFFSQDGGDTWVPVKHPGAGASINRLFIHNGQPGILYVASEAGLFRHDETQNSSRRITIDYYQQSVTDIVMSAANSTLYVSVTGGVFRSQDDGKTWSFFNSGLTHPSIRVLATDPREDSRVYAGTYSDRTADVLFVSTDYGATWNPLTGSENVLPDDDVRAIAISSHDTDVLYVSTFGSGVFRSNDRGQSWIPVNSGVTRLEIIKLRIDPKNQNVVFAIAAGGPIYRTSNSGETWQEIPETANRDIRDLAISADGSQFCIVIYGQSDNFRCSDDLGATWYRAGQGLVSRFVNQLVISSHTPDQFYAGTSDQGIFLSRNVGQSWHPINDGLANGAINSLIINNESGEIFSVVQSSGVFRFQEKYIWER